MLGAFTETSLTLSIETGWQFLPPSERKWDKAKVTQSVNVRVGGLNPACSVLGPPVSLPFLL